MLLIIVPFLAVGGALLTIVTILMMNRKIIFVS